jgi:hypothetical protein
MKMEEKIIPTHTTLDATLSSEGEANPLTALLNCLEREPHRRRKFLEIFATAAAFVRTLEVGDDPQISIDGPHQQQELTGSGGGDAWLSSFTH